MVLTGRAEVLRAQGRYEEALIAYDETLRLFPQDIVASNSRTMLLILMRKIQAAKERLLAEPPMSKEEWLAYHIRGMFQLRINEFKGAINTFRDGTQRCPFPDQRLYFAIALGAAYIRDQRIEDASNLLEALNGRLDAMNKLIRDLFLGHSFAERGDKQKAEGALAHSSSSRVPLVVRLRDSLALRYGLEKGTGLKAPGPAENLDCEIDEIEFRLLAEGPPVRQMRSGLVAVIPLKGLQRLPHMGGAQEASSRSARALMSRGATL